MRPENTGAGLAAMAPIAAKGDSISSSVSSAPSSVAGSPAPSSGRRMVWTGSPRSAWPCC